MRGMAKTYQTISYELEVCLREDKDETDLDGIFDGHGEVDGGRLGLRDRSNGLVFGSRPIFIVVRRTMIV